MKKLFLATLLLSMSAQATCLLYKGTYSYDILGHVEDGFLYSGNYGYTTIIGHFDKELLYKDRYGYDVMAHVDGDKLYKDRYGYTVIGRFDGCKDKDFKN